MANLGLSNRFAGGFDATNPAFAGNGDDPRRHNGIGGYAMDDSFFVPGMKSQTGREKEAARMAAGIDPRTVSAKGVEYTDTLGDAYGGRVLTPEGFAEHTRLKELDANDDQADGLRKAATLVAMAFGGAALAGGAAGAGAAGTGATTAGTTAATGAGTAAAATPASGLAGYMGMNAGYGATALNSGALNAGMSLARGNNIGDSLKSGATAALLSPVGTFAGKYTGSLLGDTFSKPITSGLSTIAGNTVAGGAQGAINGRGVGEGMQTGFMNGLVNAGGNYVGGIAKNETGSKNVGDFTNQMTTAALQKAFAKPPPPRKIASNGNLGLGNR